MVRTHGQLCVCERLPSLGGVKALVGTGRHVNVGGGGCRAPAGRSSRKGGGCAGYACGRAGSGDEMSRAQGWVWSKDQCKPGTQ